MAVDTVSSPPADGSAAAQATPGVIWPKDRSVRTTDGAEIGYTFLGPEHGPVVALASGYLCPDTWWCHLAPALADEGYRVLLFHYRGIATSTPPQPPAWHGVGLNGSFTVPHFAGDLLAIIQAENIDRFGVIGHSMGVQVALETYRQAGPRITALAAITGPYASPIRTLYSRRELVYLLYQPVRVLARLVPPPILRAHWRLTWRHLPAVKLAKLVQALGPRTDEQLVESFVEHGAKTDPYIALAIAAGMHAYSAEDLLEQVESPALVITGGRDPFSPPELGEHMVEAMPNAALRTAPHGTHGTIIEYPELVNGWILDFLAQHIA